MNDLITIYVNGEPYTVDGSPMSGAEIAMLAHDEDYAGYLVRLDEVEPVLIGHTELVPLYDQDRFTTTRKEG